MWVESFFKELSEENHTGGIARSGKWSKGLGFVIAEK